MFNNLVPVNKDRHGQKLIKQVDGWDFARHFHIASLMMHEFVKAAAVYPIVFLEDREQDEFRPVALLGLNDGENLFVDEAGTWRATYIPAIIRRYPFALARTNEEGQFTVVLDEDSPLVNEEEGRPLFTEDGEPSDVLENVKRYLGELQQMDEVTRNFCRFLSENNLFTPLNMRVRESDRVKNISGAYVVNEERLNNLSDERFLEIRKNWSLGALYAHLVSLGQIEGLVRLKEGHSSPEKSEEDQEYNHMH